jgi:hypothetical protein
MRTPPKSRGPSGFRAFLHIAQRRVPFITMCAQTFDYHTSETAPRIDPFASQNLNTIPATPSRTGAYQRTSNTLNSRILRHNSPRPAPPPSRGRPRRLPPFGEAPHIAAPGAPP